VAANAKWDVVIVGGANWDYLVRGPELPRPGGTVRGEQFQEAAGGKGAHQAVAAARLGARVRLLDRGIAAEAIQAGSDGDLLVWRDASGDGEAWLPHIPVETLDATGAGEAFAAALAVMVARGRRWAEAGHFASAAAALTTTKLGAQAALPTWAEVDALLARTRAVERDDSRDAHALRR
jgi:sugar/nucleoside kinase (ribokinase family)